MKLYLASFLQPENFGPGRLFGIVNGHKPLQVQVSLMYKPFIPSAGLIDKYNEMAALKNPEAGPFFVQEYEKQLTEFVSEVKAIAKQDKVSVFDILPFQEGDTLCSWERNYRTNYRKTLSKYLEELGYEVVLN